METPKKRGSMNDLLQTPYGTATELADAVIRYAMHGDRVPLDLAQAARDHAEKLTEELEVERNNRGKLIDIVDGRDARNGELIGERDALLTALRRIVAQPAGHTTADTQKDLAAMWQIANKALDAVKVQS